VKCYTAGPMRGYPEFNFPSFDSIASFMRRHGWEVANPAEHDREAYPMMTSWEGWEEGDPIKCPEFSISDAMRWDLGQITTCDAIVFLPGWEASSGASHEKYVAEVCGVELLYAYPARAGEWFVSEVYIDDYEPGSFLGKFPLKAGLEA